MNYNSNTNQDIKGKLVGREVYLNGSIMIQEFMETDKSEEIQEMFYSEIDYSSAIENWTYEATEDEVKEVKEFFEVENIEDIEEYELTQHLNLECQYYEPYEFWIVSDYFGEKLKEQGQIVKAFAGFTIWGRLTTGQSILLDHCIGMIAESMEILEGQTNQW